MFELKKVGVLSLAKISAFIMAIIGLLLGCLYALMGVWMNKLISGMTPEMQAKAGIEPGMGMLFGPWAILILPIVYGIIGLISGLFGGWLYNIISSKIGGIKIELSK
jgi:putative exporter of polyketide antibiotics